MHSMDPKKTPSFRFQFLFSSLATSGAPHWREIEVESLDDQPRQQKPCVGISLGAVKDEIGPLSSPSVSPCDVEASISSVNRNTGYDYPLVEYL